MNAPDHRNMFPPAPVMKGLRLARLGDVKRIGVVAAAGFFHSNWFTYERPFARDFPRDTIASYRCMYQTSIVDPNSIVLVVEDVINKTEIDCVNEALAGVYPSWEDQLPPGAIGDNKAVVAVATLSLQNGSERHGQFLPDGTPTLPGDPEALNRDKAPEAGKLMGKASHGIEEKYFGGRMLVDTIVVHPAYWRKGHASTLTQWQLELADHDKVGLGVEAARMGVFLFKHIGFEEVDVVKVPGYEEHPKQLDIWVGLRDPPARENDTNKADL